MMKPSLMLVFSGPNGERLACAVDLDEHTAREVTRIDPPPPPELGLIPSDQVVKILRQKQFRKDLFIAEATRLGTLLAERMEDAEGWHGVERQQPAANQLSRAANHRSETP